MYLLFRCTMSAGLHTIEAQAYRSRRALRASLVYYTETDRGQVKVSYTILQLFAHLPIHLPTYTISRSNQSWLTCNLILHTRYQCKVLHTVFAVTQS